MSANVLAPSLAERRRQLRAAYERERTYEGIAVRLNNDYLLSYQVTYLADAWLRPGYERPLWRLKQRHLLHESFLLHPP